MGARRARGNIYRLRDHFRSRFQYRNECGLVLHLDDHRSDMGRHGKLGHGCSTDVHIHGHPSRSLRPCQGLANWLF